MTPWQTLITILVMAVATVATRAIVFFLFPAGRPTPPYIGYLGKVLPCATIALLIVYCVKGVQPFTWPHGLPEFIAIAATAAVQWFTRVMLLAIVVGTVLYMALVQAVFA